MSDEISLDTFPYDKKTALTMLYLKNQDLSGLSPEELVDEYEEVYEQIKTHLKERSKDKNLAFLK